MGLQPGSIGAVRLAGGPVWVRELSGADERSVAGTDSACARALVDRVLVDAPGGAGALTVAERDLVLAHVYQRTFGERVSGVATCGGCGERYDLGFDLRDLPAYGQVPPREITLPTGERLRVPTGEDEQALVLGAPEHAARAMVERCLTEGDPEAVALEAVAQALEREAPVFDLDADAPCPECGEPNEVRFNLQAYLLGALLQERRRLFAEVHVLAGTYGWSLDEILSLARAERRMLVALIDEGRGRA